jgi:hypothetical protein
MTRKITARCLLVGAISNALLMSDAGDEYGDAGAAKGVLDSQRDQRPRAAADHRPERHSDRCPGIAHAGVELLQQEGADRTVSRRQQRAHRDHRDERSRRAGIDKGRSQGRR